MTDHRHGHFIIETFELGPNLWNARVRRFDHAQFRYGNITLRHLYVGHSWPSAEQALEDARHFVDRMRGTAR